MNDFNYPAQEKGGGFSPREFVFKYLKYVPWVILCAILFLIGAYMKLRYSTEYYQVNSKLLIKNENSYGNQDKFQDLFMMNESQNLNDEIEILKSSGLAKRIVYNLGLQTTYYTKGKVKSYVIHHDESPFILEILQLKDSTQGFGFQLKFVNESSFTLNNETEPIYFGQIIDRGYGKMRFQKRPVSYKQYASNEFSVTWQPADGLAAGIAGTFQIAPTADISNVLRITMEVENPKVGRDILNELMSEYQKLTVEDKRRTTFYTLQFIEERLDTLKTELGGVEQNLQNFRERNKAIDLEKQSLISFNELSETNTTLTTQEVQLKILNYLENYLSDPRNNNKTVPTQLGINESSLQAQVILYNTTQIQRETELRTTTPANPIILNLDAQLSKIREQMRENLNNIRQGYLINRNNLLRKSQQAQSEIGSVPEKTKQMLEITRQQKILEELYSFLLQKKLETSISSASTIANSKVVEPARYSHTPVKPNKQSVYVLALFFGLAIPIALIFVKEFLNDKISGKPDVEKLTDAPILGEVGHSDEIKTLVVTKNNRKFIAEQFRIIRTNLQYVLTKVDKPVILVTSSFSGEGKSFISTNIGAVMALAGKKTVILEFDIRKPKIIAGLEMKRKSGLTNFIVGKATMEEIITPIQQVDNLFVIACGPVPPNPAELLLDEKIRELFKYVREHFDAVIIDSAPVGLVSDAFTLSAHADATLYIMRENFTLKKQVKMIDDIYRNKKLPRLSLLLNDVKTGNSYGGYYGYGYAYGYGHNSGYFTEEDKQQGILKKLRKIFSLRR